MRKRRWILGLAVMLAGCASASVSRPVPEAGSVPVRNRYHWGHVCPTSATQAFTAEHVSTIRRDEKWVRYPLIYTIGEQGGTLIEAVSDSRRDLSIVMIVEGPEFKHWFEISDEAPRPGDTVFAQGYRVKDGMTPILERHEVLAIGQGSFTYKGSPGHGSSGSCVVLERTGKLVGINTNMLVESYGSEVTVVGVAWSVYKPWDEIPERWRE